MNLILGGTHGLGQEIAAELRRRGEETFVIGRSYDEVVHGPGMKADLSNEEDVKKLEEYIDKARFKGFFWVAGYGYKGDFAKQQDTLRMVKVNLANVLPVAQAAWNRLLKLKVQSNYVVISSMTGVKPRPDEAVYAATKHGQVGFARSLGLESERLKSRIKVALFMPGGMHTPFWEGKEPANFMDFLDPHKVAKRVVEEAVKQKDYFLEETVQRGSL
jgi:3-oxoacyl-[acyl-carrier protein] reductase